MERIHSGQNNYGTICHQSKRYIYKFPPKQTRVWKRRIQFSRHKYTTKASLLEEAEETKQKLANKAEDDRVSVDQAIRNHASLLKLSIQRMHRQRTK